MKMEILKFDGGKPSQNRNKLVTVIAGAFLFAVVGSTFAANITINTNNSLEYGQGLTQAAACDNAMNIVPTNRFVNESGSTGKFYIETITVTDTSTSGSAGLGKCIGSKLKISAYDSSTASALFSCQIIPTSYSTNLLASGGVTSVTNCSSGTYSGRTDGFSLVFSNPASTPGVQANNIFKLTIESN